MNIKQVKNELQNILSGKSSYSYDATIQTITSYLRTSQKTGYSFARKFQNKQEETENLITFATENNLFYNNIDKRNYISEGAEQKVYIKNQEDVLKLNDAIYYTSWQDYFQNLLLHNYFFADTAYQFLGFYKDDNDFFAVVKQSFVVSDEDTELKEVKQFLLNNGFVNNRNHDYIHKELGIILEDLHDENVLAKKEILYL